jgi:nucleoid-associated protein YgaU
MPAVTVRISAAPAPKRPQATIVSDRGRRLVLPFAPVEATLDGLTPAWSTVGRTGRQQLLLPAGAQLNTWHGQLLFAHPDWHVSVQPWLDTLAKIATTGDAVHFTYGGPERGRWRITGCPVDVVLRTPSGAPARALVDLTLTEASDVAAHVGPLSGGAKRPAPAKTSGPAGGSATSRPHPGAPTSYVVRQGDTLWAIAGRVYGDPNDWHRIADANKIRDPRTLQIGRRLVIP